MPGAALPGVSPPPPTRAARPPDTRAAATRNPRGITPEAHRDHFFAAPAAQKNPTASRVSSRNSVVRLHKSQQTGPQKHRIMQRYCEISRLAAATLAIIYLLPRVTRAVPSSVVALVLVTAGSLLFGVNAPRIGAIPSGLPVFVVPELDFTRVSFIVTTALELALLGA